MVAITTGRVPRYTQSLHRAQSQPVQEGGNGCTLRAKGAYGAYPFA